MTQPSTAYARAVGAVVAFLIVGLLVKYSELLFTYEHRWLIQPQGTVRSRLLQFWLSLRFSWQEFAAAAALLAVLVLWSRWRPEPGRLGRTAVLSLRAVLAVTSLISVFGIAYYAVYHTHFSMDDLEYIGFAPQLLASADLFSHTSIAVGVVAWGVATIGLPLWIVRWPPGRVTRLAAGGAVLLAGLAGVTWVAGRPNLAEARLEPHPVVWMVFGERVSYANLPPAAEMAPIGVQRRIFEPALRPRNIVLVILESTPASAITAYNQNATGGRRLFAEFADDITTFEHVFAVAPNSTSAFVSIMAGETPAPTASAALKATAGVPTLSEVLKARGFQTRLLVNGGTDPVMDALAARGFDRSLNMHSTWDVGARHARTTWGFDDRMLFEEAQVFLERQTADAPPWFLAVHTNNPHHPYASELVQGLGTSDDPQERHRRLVDHQMDRLTDFYRWLKASGVAETTAVIAVGDHGEAFGEHVGNYIHSKELYAENLHVPMLLLHPQRLGLPARVPQLGSLDDVRPTVLDLLGVDAPPRSGMSLLFEAPDRVLLHLTDWGPGQVGFRDARYTWILSRTGRELLFDRRADPGEQHNILGTHPEVADAFRARLKGR